MKHLIAALFSVSLSLWACFPGWTAPGSAAAPSGYENDFRAFVKEIDAEYPFFDLKGTRADWTLAKADLEKRAGTCASDGEFLQIVLDAIKCLRDGHMQVRDAKCPLPRPPPSYYSGISFLPATGRRVVVMYPPPGREGALKTGTVVTAIDGREARGYLEERAEKTWKQGGSFSSPQRARLYEYRMPLRGQKGDRHTIRCLVNGEEREFDLVSDREADGWPHRYNPPAGLASIGRSVHYATLSGNIGYLWIRRINETTAESLAEALAACPGRKGWVVDLRGNGGGGYDNLLIEKLKAFPRPTAVLIDAGCMSAGETLARDLVSCCQARRFGERTAGASSAKRTWGFPSGIASVVFPTRSRWGVGGIPIEFNGIAPDVDVEAVPEELLAGKNSEILRAVEYLETQSGAPAGRKAGGGEPGRTPPEEP